MSRPDPLPADSADLPDALRSVIWDVVRRFRYASQTEADLPWTQQAALHRLDKEPGLTSAELARAERVRPQSMNTMVAALRRSGCVQATKGAADARRLELSLTPEGERLLGTLRSRRDDWLATRIAAEFSAAEQEELRAAVGLLRRLIDE